MTLNELKLFIKQGKTGVIPGWKGYIKWDYSKDELYFVNNDYKMSQTELKDKTNNRTDLFYII